MTRAAGHTIEILLVEDNPGDVKLAEKAFARTKMANLLHTVTDGVQAMDFLRRRGPYADAPRPDVILLDLNLPGMDGRDVLIAVKGDDDLRRIPVVILSSSHAERDVRLSYDAHANCYVAKPVDFSGMMDVINAIDEFWLQTVTLPDY